MQKSFGEFKKKKKQKNMKNSINKDILRSLNYNQIYVNTLAL